MQPSPLSGRRFRLKKRLSAVKLHSEADRTHDDVGVAVQIPAGEVVQVDGTVTPAGMRDVIWKGEFYALFEQDLLDNSDPV